MASDLFGRHDRLLNARVGADLTKLGELHILQALRVFRQANVAHHALDVVDEPSLTVDRNDWDCLACDVSKVIQNATTRHQVFVDLALFDSLLANLNRTNGRELLKLLVVQLLAAVALFFA